MADIISNINISDTPNFFVFPSSSSNNRGKLLSEINLRDINGLITTRNYKVEHTDFQLTINGNSNLQISSGIALINGYRIVIPETISLGEISGLTPNVPYNVNLRLSVQNSTSGIVVNDDNENGKVYFDFTPKGDEQTLEDIINNTVDADGNYYYRDYKPAVNRFSVSSESVRIEKVEVTEDFSNNFAKDTLPVISNENKFTALNWIANRHHGLFVNAMNYAAINLSDLDFNASRENGNPLFKLTIGYITTDGSQFTANTYDCVKRLDADNIYVGDQTLLDYLASSGSLLKSYGKNIVTAVRENETLGDASTGNLKDISYVSTLDSAFPTTLIEASTYVSETNYYYYDIENNEYVFDSLVTDSESFTTEKTKYGNLYTKNVDRVYLYVPLTYIGEMLEETYDFIPLTITSQEDFNTALEKYGNPGLYIKNPSEESGWESVSTYSQGTDYYAKVPATDVMTDVSNLKSIIECSFDSVPNETSAEAVTDIEGNKYLYGSQILSVTSLKDCSTSYGYNVITRAEDGEGGYTTKTAKLNKHYIGIPNADSYASENPQITPPFGLYDEGNNVFIGFENRYGENNSSKDIILNKANQSIVILTANATEQTAVANDYEDGDYNAGDLVNYNNLVYYCNVTHTVLVGTISNVEKTYRVIKDENEFEEIKAGNTSIYTVSNDELTLANPQTFSANTYYVLTTPKDDCSNYWSIAYFNSGTTFETDQEKSLFNIYSGGSNVSYAGFVNESNVAKLILNNGSESSKIYVDGTDSNDKPIIKFDDNINVGGYVRANRVYDAVYNDYAEWYNSSEAENIEEGDIIYYNPEKDEYTNHSLRAKRVVGICSEDYGFIVGGKQLKDMSENRKDHIPVSLCGRVKVKIIPDHEFQCGDYVYANGTSIGVGNGNQNEIVGKFIKYADEKGFAIVQVQLS